MWTRELVIFAIIGAVLVAAAGRQGLLENHELHKIADAADLGHLKEAVRNILVPRVVGTDGHNNVKAYIKSSLAELGWTVQTDRFDEKTPNLGVKTFENVFALSNPDAKEFLLIAAHYDSKYFPNAVFVGATDSAVPCAMMLNLLKTLQAPFNDLKSRTDLGLAVVFFDGEEAFQDWTATDSIYGARHLAQRWENEGFLPKIKLFMLLDLLGAPDPVFYSYFTKTQDSYFNMLQAEERLLNTGFLDKYSYSSVADRSVTKYFQPNAIGVGIEDDHIPFLRRNVPILHVIPTPFPSVWHRLSDDGQAIDYVTVENLNRILRLFTVEYLNLTI